MTALDWELKRIISKLPNTVEEAEKEDIDRGEIPDEFSKDSPT
jgi:hypothetical protein